MDGDFCRENYLDMINKDIYILRRLMYMARDQTGRIDDSLVLEISQYLDQKIAKHIELIKTHT
ncbi:Spo0E family sporulation regulatory protein-aspartic acid phosphatase [Bacillus sp. CGMCC 1.16607]|uniref:Spo0E family sporulation regulatory protein-aspartic acid phosphatase n=1 Tax=Bacillus sp. CGMCC 1.16607 TaxID=3351842 RepID=UPI003638E3EC